MVGKQGWKLMLHQESLVGRIYKARNYLNGSFLSAKLGGNPSYIWRSIVAAQDLLRRGAARRVGNGLTVNILEDPWLSNEEDPYIHTVNDALSGTMVSSLLLPEQNQWDIDLLTDMFEERDINLIISTPIRHNETESWYWRKEMMGALFY